MDNIIWINIITIVLFIAGLAGSALPFLPGPPLSWAGLLLYGIYTDFAQVSLNWIIAFGVITAIILLIDAFAPVLGAKGYKASRFSILLSIIGMILGPFVLGPFGIVIGPFVGSFVGEMIVHRNQEKAFRVAWGSLVGFFAGTFLKMVIVLAMGTYLLIAIF